MREGVRWTVPRTQSLWNLTCVYARDSAGFVDKRATRALPAGGKLSCDYLSMRFSRTLVSQRSFHGPGDRSREKREKRSSSGSDGKRAAEGRRARRRGGTVRERKREREGRVSSSRQKQIAIVCAEPRQCRAWGASITCLSRLYHLCLSLPDSASPLLFLLLLHPSLLHRPSSSLSCSSSVPSLSNHRSPLWSGGCAVASPLHRRCIAGFLPLRARRSETFPGASPFCSISNPSNDPSVGRWTRINN